MSYYVGNMAEPTWRYAAIRQSRLRGLSAGSMLLASEYTVMVRVGALSTNLAPREVPETSTYDWFPPKSKPDHRIRKINVGPFRPEKDPAPPVDEDNVTGTEGDDTDDGVDEPPVCEDLDGTCPTE